MPQNTLLEPVAQAIRTVSEAARQPDVTIVPESDLVEHLGLDSLDLVAVVMRLQDAYQVEMDLDAVPSFRRVEDLMAQLEHCLRARAEAA